MRGHRLLTLPCLLAALAIAGCGSSDKKSDESAATPAATSTPADTATPASTPSSPGKVSVSGPLGKKPKITVTAGSAPTKLVIKDIKTGHGKAAKAGDTVSVQYAGDLFDGGQQFDASWDRGQPFSFPLGQGQVIPGWDQGVAGMKVGGRRLLIIPPDLGYGASGSGPIPPNSPLIFVVDLEKIG
jgi:peptidylprolyl isomerase